MPQSNVGIRINIDTGQARSQVQDLSQTIADLNREIRDATSAGDWQSVAQLTQALDSATSGRGQIMNQARQAQAAQASEGIFGGQGMWLFQQSLSTITHGILTAWDAALTAAKQRASGDYTGAAVSTKRAKEEGIGQTIGMGIGATGFFLGPMIGMMTTALGSEIGKFVGGIGAKRMEENLAWSNQYKNALQGIDSLNQLYGGAINEKAPEENNRYGMELRGRATESAEWTGLDTDRFIEAMGKTASYGKLSFSEAAGLTKDQAMWARFTGADLGTIQKFAGQAYRYSGDAGAMSTAYGGLMAQNMGKGQSAEYLNALSRILEESIAKGFTKSTEEIAGNMQMLYTLSGGSALWQGEQGAQRFSQMSSSIAGAVALETPAHSMVYSAVSGLLKEGGPENRDKNYKELMGFKNLSDSEKKLLAPTDTYIDNMALIERMGASGKMLGSVKGMVEGFEGDNIAGIIEWYKQIYGLNYLGGMQLYNMMEGKSYAEITSDKFEQEVKDNIIDKNEYKSDSAIYKNMVNDLGQLGAKIGQIEFPKTEMQALTKALVDLEKAYSKRTDPNYDPAKDIDEMPVMQQKMIAEELENARLAEIEKIRILGSGMSMRSAAAGRSGEYATELSADFRNIVFPKISNDWDRETVDTANRFLRDFVFSMSTDSTSGKTVDNEEYRQLRDVLDKLVLLLENPRPVKAEFEDLNINLIDN